MANPSRSDCSKGGKSYRVGPRVTVNMEPELIAYIIRVKGRVGLKSFSAALRHIIRGQYVVEQLELKRKDGDNRPSAIAAAEQAKANKYRRHRRWRVEYDRRVKEAKRKARERGLR